MAEWNAFGDWVWASLAGLSTLAPLGTFGVVVMAYLSYRQKTAADRTTISQKTEADNRNAWWHRVQWAVDASLSDDEQRRATGLAALVEMQDSPLATDADRALLSALALNVQDEEIADIDPDWETAAQAVAAAAEMDDNEGSEGGVQDGTRG